MPGVNEPRTISEAAELIRRGESTPLELLEQCLARVDRFEHRVRAWACLDRDEVRLQAERLTEELKQGRYRGPLHGIPIGVKDIIDVFDLPTGCGSKLWHDSIARRDAACVAALRTAGAVIMGKTVTTAYASFDPSITRNPWNLERTPGGSSSGSAAAVACGMCLGALASQTGGSITRPASYCGVYSLKPTYGRVSVEGVLPLAPSLDHVGAMASSVRDLALLLQPLAGTSDERPSKHYLAELTSGSLKRQPLIGTLPDFLPGQADQEMQDALQEVEKNIRAAGWPLRAMPLPASFAEVAGYHHAVMAVEAAAYHAERLRRHPEDYPPRIASLIRDGLETPAPRYSRIMAHHAAYRDEIDEVFREFGTTLITPATVGPAPALETTGNPAFNSPWSYSGLPVLSLPVAWSRDGLPLCVQLIGRRWGEAELLRVGAQLERLIAFPRREVDLG
jgi:aspartyl-tRNA(Asn)/glutamyl-tRNA(Gln) amidotransferase subunit A